MMDDFGNEIHYHWQSLLEELASQLVEMDRAMEKFQRPPIKWETIRVKKKCTGEYAYQLGSPTRVRLEMRHVIAEEIQEAIVSKILWTDGEENGFSLDLTYTFAGELHVGKNT